MFLEQASRIWNPDETSLSVLAVEFSHGLHNCYLFHIIFHASLRQQNFILTQTTLRRVFPERVPARFLRWAWIGSTPADSHSSGSDFDNGAAGGDRDHDQDFNRDVEFFDIKRGWFWF